MDEGWVRYDQLSGSTHLLSPLARFIVELINKSTEELSPSAIADKVLDVEKDADPVECLIEVESALHLLSEAQLIEPVQR